MSDIESANFSETAGGNNAASPNGAPEGMAPSGVNDTIREIMAAIKRDWNRSHPTVTSGGAANAQTLTYGAAPAGYFQGQRFCFTAGFHQHGRGDAERQRHRGDGDPACGRGAHGRRDRGGPDGRRSPTTGHNSRSRGCRATTAAA